MADQGDTDQTSQQNEVSTADIITPAPVLALWVFAIGLIIHLIKPVELIRSPWNVVVGGALVVIGVILLFGALRAMQRIDKSPDHDDEPTQLITSGPFRYTRHPLYLGLISIYLGTTSLLNSVWPLIPLGWLIWYFDRVAKREEKYLQSAFGDEFIHYSENVRRWL